MEKMTEQERVDETNTLLDKIVLALVSAKYPYDGNGDRVVSPTGLRKKPQEIFDSLSEEEKIDRQREAYAAHQVLTEYGFYQAMGLAFAEHVKDK